MPRIFRGFPVLCVTAISFLAQQAYAQADDDWVVSADANQDLVVAEAHYSAGQSIKVQCVAGQITVGLMGIPASSESTRSFRRQRDSGPIEVSVWEVGADGETLIQRSPRTIRSLKRDAVLRLDSIDSEQDQIVIALPLPSQSSGIDTVMSACGRSVEDDRDELLDASTLVTKFPVVQMAPFSSRQFTVVTLELSCLIKNSRLADCRPEYEWPNAGIGQRTARNANGSRLQLSDPAVAEGGLLEFVVTGNRIYR